ncbi:MAG: class D sortase [Acidobacteriota bacterium]
MRKRKSPGVGPIAPPGLLPSVRATGMVRGVVLLRHALTGTAAVCLATWASVTVWVHVSQALDKARLARMVQASAANVSNRGASAPSHGALLGRVDIPAVDVSTVILEGTEARWLAQAAGHVPNTALPGTEGNAVIAGHRDSFFRGLRNIRVGDEITIRTPALTRTYIVDSTEVVDPRDTTVLASRGGPELTLVTCYPFTYVGPAPKRFVVHALGLPGGRDPGASRASSPAAPVVSVTTLARRRTDRHGGWGAAGHGRSVAKSGRDRPHGTVVDSAAASATSRGTERKLPWWKRLFARRLSRSSSTSARFTGKSRR